MGMLRNQFRKQHCKNTALPEHLNYRGLLQITTTNLIVFNLGIAKTLNALFVVRVGLCLVGTGNLIVCLFMGIDCSLEAK